MTWWLHFFGLAPSDSRDVLGMTIAACALAPVWIVGTVMLFVM